MISLASSVQRFSIAALCIVLVAGCSPTGDVADTGFGAVTGGKDWTVPVPAAKPVVWRDDWTEPPSESAERKEAEQAMHAADLLKASERYQEAEQSYQEAIQLDPTWGYPPYQLACNYELWGKPEQALPLFQKAVALGFDDFPMALDDDELGTIRDRSDFAETLWSIRERYVMTASAKVGQPFAVRPAGDPPSNGWPMMLLLHGYGDTNASYETIAFQWAEQGFLTIAVPGSVPMRHDGFQWSADSSATTHEQLQSIVRSELFDGLVNRSQVHLLGFSQGALHSMLVTMEHPGAYQGVIALSPGGSMFDRIVSPELVPGKPSRLAFVYGLQEPHGVYADRWSDACKAADWRFLKRTHPGGHHFPEDWNELVPVFAEFLLSP
ncbi:MAG: alpha/beta hydrolase-fold protein [Planctomycetota bacterium]